MGQKQSKRLSSNSTTPLNPNTRTNTLEPEITGPAPPRTIYRLSELFDPAELAREDSQALNNPSDPFPPDSNAPRRPLVESPSGQILNAEQFAEHANRPLSLRERQEEIVRRTLAAMETAETPGGHGMFAEGQGGRTGVMEQGKKKKRRGCCGFY